MLAAVVGWSRTQRVDEGRQGSGEIVSGITGGQRADDPGSFKMSLSWKGERAVSEVEDGMFLRNQQGHES